MPFRWKGCGSRQRFIKYVHTNDHGDRCHWPAEGNDRAGDAGGSSGSHLESGPLHLITWFFS